MHDCERRRVLVVDDERAFAEVLTELLRDEAYLVQVSFDGRHALDAIDTGALRPDIILCDVMLPGLRGDGFVSELRSRFPDLRLPVVLMSASADPRVQARDVWFLPKPLDFNELIAFIADVIDSDPTVDSCPAA